jgi:hypothetical protein
MSGAIAFLTSVLPVRLCCEKPRPESSQGFKVATISSFFFGAIAFNQTWISWNIL